MRRPAGRARRRRSRPAPSSRSRAAAPSSPTSSCSDAAPVAPSLLQQPRPPRAGRHGRRSRWPFLTSAAAPCSRPSVRDRSFRAAFVFSVVGRHAIRQVDAPNRCRARNHDAGSSRNGARSPCSRRHHRPSRRSSYAMARAPQEGKQASPRRNCPTCGQARTTGPACSLRLDRCSSILPTGMAFAGVYDGFGMAGNHRAAAGDVPRLSHRCA